MRACARGFALRTLGALLVLAAAQPAAGQVFYTKAQALKLAFPEAQAVASRTLFLTREQARRIAALADAWRIPLAPHNPQGPVSTAASLEFGFSQPGYIICESVHSDVPWRHDIVDEGFVVDPATRTVRPGTRPGLGIEINEDEVRRHPFEPEIPQRVFYRDGSVGDW